MAIPPSPYRHAEAYCLMTYTADDGSETEQVWNSRDGVTPFVITLRSGKTATHTNWASDQRMPEDWKPPPGTRVFADLTEERARQHAAAAIERWMASPELAEQTLTRFGGDREAAVNDIAGAYMTSPNAPDLIDPEETPAP